MKYFEVYVGFYALIKAENKEIAMKIFLDVVCDVDQEILNERMREISRDRALVKFTLDTANLKADEILNDFIDPNVEVLLIKEKKIL